MGKKMCLVFFGGIVITLYGDDVELPKNTLRIVTQKGNR